MAAGPGGDDHLGANGRYKDIMTRRGTTLSREGIAERRLFTHTGLGSTFHLQYADAWLKDTLTALWKTRCSVDRPYACSTLTPTSFINTVAHQRG